MPTVVGGDFYFRYRGVNVTRVQPAPIVMKPSAINLGTNTRVTKRKSIHFLDY